MSIVLSLCSCVLFLVIECFNKLVKNKRLDLISNFNRTSRYLDDILNINNPDFEKYISDIYPKELTLTEANTCDTHVAFLELDLTVTNSGNIITKILIKEMIFDFL